MAEREETIRRVEEAIGLELYAAYGTYSIECYGGVLEVRANSYRHWDHEYACCMLDPDDPNIKSDYSKFLLELKELHSKTVAFLTSEIRHIDRLLVEYMVES